LEGAAVLNETEVTVIVRLQDFKFQRELHFLFSLKCESRLTNRNGSVENKSSATASGAGAFNYEFDFFQARTSVTFSTQPQHL
jgi:hypothetical protein